MKPALRISVFRAGLIFSGWLASFTPSAGFAAESYSIHWSTNVKPVSVEVIGLDAAALKLLTNLSTAEWQKLFAVYASQGEFTADMTVPPMLGTYGTEGNAVRFVPKFPLGRGVTYRAVFRPGRLPGAEQQSLTDVVSTFRLPDSQSKPSTMVTQIYPSAHVLPENLLKFYIHFSAPMQGGHIYEHIHLREESGKLVELPFLEIDEELWNREMTRLTLFIDPGRIKRGVQPLEEIGPALETGKRYILEIDAGWRDSNGLPLKEAFRKAFLVGPLDREPVSLATWKVNAPKAGTRNELTVNFPKPMDHALALRVIGVADAAGLAVKGATELSNHEQQWSFTPQMPWVAGRHELHVLNTIEDLAGNNIGKAFEVDLFEGVQRRFTNTVVKLAFEVR